MAGCIKLSIASFSLPSIVTNGPDHQQGHDHSENNDNNDRDLTTSKVVTNDHSEDNGDNNAMDLTTGRGPVCEGIVND